MPFRFISVSSNVFHFCPVHHLFVVDNWFERPCCFVFLGPGRINSAALKKRMRLPIHPNMVSVRDSIHIFIAREY